MPRLITLLAIAALLTGCQLVSSEGKTLIRFTPDHASGNTDRGDDPADAHQAAR